MDRALHSGKWVKKTGLQLEGKTVAIIGFGRIGRRLAELLMPFKVKLVVVDPYLKEESNNYYTKLLLERALPLADIVTIHSSGETCILSEGEFSLMKQGVFLLNAARGGLVSEEALLKSIQNGKVAGAWIDTFGEEPYSGPLCHFDNVILTPHIGSYTFECRKRMETEAVENLINSLKE
jgi:D-3-phosphoglycerate dehydrogenase